MRDKGKLLNMTEIKNNTLYGASTYYYSDYYNKFIDIDNASIFSLATAVVDRLYLHDRFNIIDDSKYNWKSTTPLPTFSSNKVTLADACASRVEELTNIAENSNKKLMIMWSGGVDSTLVLVSFLMYGNTKNIEILLSNESIVENGSFFNRYIENKIKYTKYSLYDANETFDKLIKKNKYYFVSGQVGDQLYGSAFNVKNSEFYFVPWKNAIHEIYRRYSGFCEYVNLKYDPTSLAEKHIDIYEKYAKQLGFNLTIGGELFWLMNFCFKYDYIKMEHPLLICNNYMLDNYAAFYDSVMFQDWSIQNYSRLREYNMYSDPKKYKQDSKEIIYRFDGNRNYYNCKSKHGSHVTEIDKKSKDSSHYSYVHTIAICDNNGLRRIDFPSYEGIDHNRHLYYVVHLNRIMKTYEK